MLSLHVSNRTENLLNELARLLREEPRDNLFAPELFLIQSQGMERMVAQSLADAFGCFCNFKFFLPLDFLGFIADRLGLGISPDGFHRQILTWRLDQLLREVESEVYRPLRFYLTGESVGVKRFQLARRLANILDQYQLMRPEMIAGWEKGRLVTANTAEAWQMDLWRRLAGQVPVESARIHRGELFRQVAARLAANEDLSPLLPRRISVVGLHTMPPLYLEYLDRLAAHMDIHLLVLSPCRHYWGDVESRRARLKRVARQGAAEDDPYEPGHHPLLMALGRQGRDFQRMLLENVEGFLDSDSYDDPLTDEAYRRATLLRRIQADLLEDVAPQPDVRLDTPPDDSILVVSCHSKLRELAVLKDHLLRLLHRDPGLNLRDIVVMAPDIQEYAALIPAVFAGIQHAIADRSLRRRNPVIAAFVAFLDLFTGRFGWSEVLDLLRQPAVFPRFQLTEADLDTLQQWVVGAGIRWGLSGEQRVEDSAADFAEGSWRAGLERLLMGYAIDSTDFVDGILPFPDLEGRGGQPLGGLCGFVTLLEEARLALRQPRTLGEWSETLLHYAGQLFDESEEQPLAELQAILAEPAESAATFHRGRVDFVVIREWLTQSAKESRSSSGFLRGQLTFCSMLPMRSIPFRVVCLLGLNDGVFPKNDRHDTFDLMAGDFRPGDRSPRDDDRYQFLEALLAARSHLYLSYVGQSIRSGDPIPPSVVVSEFLELLETSYGVAGMTVNQPLHPFSSRYFSGEEPRLFSYDDACCRVAQALQRGPQASRPWWRGRTEDEVGTVALGDLMRFYAHPQKYFVVDRLGIRLNEIAEAPEERELFEPDGLDRYRLDQELVAGAISVGDSLLPAIQHEGRWPLGAPGLVALAERRAEAERFLQRVAAEQPGRALEAQPVDLEIGKYRLVGALQGLHEHGFMLPRFGSLRGRDLLAGWISHLVANLLLPGTVTRVVALDKVVIFSRTDADPGLERLLELFAEGCRRPLPLLVEPGFACARQENNGRARTTPEEKARQLYRSRLEDGYEPEWRLIYGEARPEEVLGEESFALCREVLCAVWRNADVR